MATKVLNHGNYCRITQKHYPMEDPIKSLHNHHGTDRLEDKHLATDANDDLDDTPTCASFEERAIIRLEYEAFEQLSENLKHIDYLRKENFNTVSDILQLSQERFCDRYNPSFRAASMKIQYKQRY